MKILPVSLLVAVCLFPAVARAQPEATPRDNVVGETELHEAVTLAVAHVKAILALSKRTGPNEYRVIGATNLLQKGLTVWLITFKPTTLIPKDPTKSEIGAGGDMFVTVDLETKKCTLTSGE